MADEIPTENDKEAERFRRELNNLAYAIEVYGGTSKTRGNAVAEELDVAPIHITPHEVETEEDFLRLLSKDMDSHRVSYVDARRTLSDEVVLFEDFHRLSDDDRTNIARQMKAIVESGFEGGFVVTTETGERLVKDEPNLRGRVKSWRVRDH